VNPQLTREWLEYSQARGFATDPARVRHPRDKPFQPHGIGGPECFAGQRSAPSCYAP